MVFKKKSNTFFGNFDSSVKPRLVDGKYSWTNHSLEKMKHYGLSEARVKRIIRFPQRTEEGILENTVAVMQPISPIRSKDGQLEWKREIWAMYKIVNSKPKTNNSKQIRIITAWRYPGRSPARDPVPAEIIREVMTLL
ncbi:MAG: hypothetical protein Q8O49_01355 [bacterium]|nr:hypothetical protein [bacterium]